MSLAKELKAIGACKEAVEWATDYESLAKAWESCERPDWMLWLCGTMEGQDGWPSRKQIVSVACDITESVLHIYEKLYPNDSRVRDCISVTRKWVAGKASIEDVRNARYAAAAATAAAAYATDAAATAADAATTAAATAAAYTTDAAAYAAAANVAAYAYATDAAAYAAAAKRKELCSLIREKLTIPDSLASGKGKP